MNLIFLLREVGCGELTLFMIVVSRYLLMTIPEETPGTAFATCHFPTTCADLL